jgi:glutamate---cysteine ligase / carboxylate-amine ligase
MLLDPAGWSLAQASDDVLAHLARDFAPSAQAETHASVVELATGIHRDVAGVVAELRELRGWLLRELREMGLAAAAAGTHPAADWAQTEVSEAPRYRVLEETMRSLVRREPTMALHVHVGVPDPHAAIRLLNAVRPMLPLLLALSANSPFSQGSDGGFASNRRLLFGAFPRTGTPRSFDSYHDYVNTVDALIESGALPDPSFLWWDVRPQPRLGTVELRIMDAQSSVADIEPIVALIQSYARLVLEDELSVAPAGPELLEENAFLAARDGISARLIDPVTRRLVPVRELVDSVVGACRPHAVALGCEAELEGIRRLCAANGARRQRSLVASGAGLERLVAGLSDQFAFEALAVVRSAALR